MSDCSSLHSGVWVHYLSIERKIGLTLYVSRTPVLFHSRYPSASFGEENVHDLETFFKLIGRNCNEHLDSFEGNLDKFLATSSKDMKEMGIDVSTRKYMLRWKHKFVNDLEPLREHKRGKKKNGGERKARTVIAKRKALERLEAKERHASDELEAERKGERTF